MHEMRTVWSSLWVWVCVLAAACGSSGSTGDATPGDSGLRPTLELLAGNIGGYGNADGPGPEARFNNARGVAIDGAGNVYIADSFNLTIRKVSPTGVVTTLAGAGGKLGSVDGTGGNARFLFPWGLAADSAGNVYVADAGAATIRKITAAGVVTTLAGTPGMFGTDDGTGPDARFDEPVGVAVDSAGNVYVADDSAKTIRKITPAAVVTTLAGTPFMAGSADGTGPDARFNFPTDVAVDSAGNLYVADAVNRTIRKITATGVVTTLAGSPGTQGSADGTGGAASFDFPSNVAVDSAGNIYVAEPYAHTIRKVTPGGEVTTLAGRAGMADHADGTGSAARFSSPSGVAVDGAGNVYVSDQLGSVLRKIGAGGVVTTVAGSPSAPGGADGTGRTAQLSAPGGVAADSTGNLYVADTSNSTIRKITPDGVVTTLAGSAGMEDDYDGGNPYAHFRRPDATAVDSAGNVYVADTLNDTIRKIVPDGWTATLVGSPLQPGPEDGQGTDARFRWPSGIAIDGAGNLYVADQHNHTIRKVTPHGAVTTLAGMPRMRGSADGTGSAAQFSFPTSVVVDGTGNVFVTDSDNATIRKVTPAGVVTTLAGKAGATGSADGPGAEARFERPIGIALDRSGNLYVSDNAMIRKITPAGMVSTVAGKAGIAKLVLGDTPGLAFPLGLAIVDDSIVICDNNAILVLRHGAP